jgi:hypothetical protein
VTNSFSPPLPENDTLKNIFSGYRILIDSFFLSKLEKCCANSFEPPRHAFFFSLYVILWLLSSLLFPLCDYDVVFFGLLWIYLFSVHSDSQFCFVANFRKF